mmetsp:Transcript_18876/g.49534  ORF Transcript_18876/g.49534 Transcript_18876/m.49534 type:complete len:283 (+) Transcript_18876:141-989(+)
MAPVSDYPSPAASTSARIMSRVSSKSGWLAKADPAKYFSAVPRWFVLHVEKGVLEWFERENGRSKGCIDLRSVVGLGDSWVKEKNMFRIIMANRIYELTSESPADCREWIASLAPFVNTAVMRARSFDRLTHDGHRATVPWAIDSVWKTEDDFDQALVHNIDLGTASADGGFKVKVKLSDGTTYEVDTLGAKLQSDKPAELFQSGNGILLAQLVRTPRSRYGQQNRIKEASTGNGPPLKPTDPNQAAQSEAMHHILLGASLAMAAVCIFRPSPALTGIVAAA